MVVWLRVSPRCSTARSTRAAAGVAATCTGAIALPARLPPKVIVQSPALPVTVMSAPAAPVAARSAVCTCAAVLARDSAAVVLLPAPTSTLSVKVPCAPAGACTRCCAAVFCSTGVTVLA